MGYVEIGIHESWIGWINSENLSCELLLKDTYGFVWSKEHPLASQQTFSFADLSNSTVIQLSDDSAIRKRLDEETQIKHFLRTDIETSDATSLIWMIGQNLGASVLPENAAMVPTNGSVYFLPIEGF